jgi:hypothetical protein
VHNASALPLCDGLAGLVLTLERTAGRVSSSARIVHTLRSNVDVLLGSALILTLSKLLLMNLLQTHQNSRLKKTHQNSRQKKKKKKKTFQKEIRWMQTLLKSSLLTMHVFQRYSPVRATCCVFYACRVFCFFDV